ncbi:MAG: Trk system potassium transporter TrkA [Clostridia bacterium]|nr:Trk system potassium transporter TrkA [Clostridia bacterium]
MNIVIMGQGKIGRTLTKVLSKEDHEITVIDINPKTVENMANSYDVMGVVGNGASYNVQLEAGVQKADLIVATTPSDEVNILCCLLAKKIGAKHTIARVRNPEYSNQLYFLKKDLGLSLIVNPELDAASEMFKIISFPSALKLDIFARGKVELAEIKIEDGNPLDGQILSQLYKKYNVKILVCIVERDDEVYIPGGDFILKKGDRIYITASHAELSQFFKLLKIYQHKLKKVMVIGGGRLGYYLSEQLLSAGIDVKLIEQDENRCLELSDLLPKATIICGDGTDQTVLQEEGIDNTDAIVSLTGIDEENMVISMFAQKYGIKKVITKIDRSSFVGMLNTIGIESIISPKIISVNRVLSYIRAMTNTESSSLKTMYEIVEGRVEALEFEISESSEIIGIPLKDLRIKKGIIIGCIIRRDRVIFPGGNDTIERNDSVIVITKNQELREINEILQ